jgi:hypothetical protein
MAINPLTFLFDLLLNMVNITTEIYDWLMRSLPFTIFGATTYFELFLGAGLITVLGILVVKAIL